MTPEFFHSDRVCPQSIRPHLSAEGEAALLELHRTVCVATLGLTEGGKVLQSPVSPALAPGHSSCPSREGSRESSPCLARGRTNSSRSRSRESRSRMRKRRSRGESCSTSSLAGGALVGERGAGAGQEGGGHHLGEEGGAGGRGRRGELEMLGVEDVD